jgi:type IX secretion system PorP/SprF family membrane protein
MMRILFFMVPLFIWLDCLGQHDPLYSQYMFNLMAVNPAYAGSRDLLSLQLVNRYQWVGLEGAPKTLSAGISSPLRNKKIALGLYIYYNTLGPMQNWGVLTNYTYSLKVGEDKSLSFGIDGGIRKLDIDWNIISPQDQDDESIIGRPEYALQPDFNFGIFFNAEQYCFGLSMKHLFEHALNVEYNNGIYTIASLARHFYLIGSYALPTGKNLVLKPSLLIKYTMNIPWQFDISMSALIAGRLWIGLSYRTIRNTLVFFTEIYAGKNFQIGYSYDTYISKFSGHSQGSHELMLNWAFDIFKVRLMHEVEVRYF